MKNINNKTSAGMPGTPPTGEPGTPPPGVPGTGSSPSGAEKIIASSAGFLAVFFFLGSIILN